MKTQVGQKLQERIGTVVVLFLAMWFSTGCSTPSVPVVYPDQQDTAWYAYQQCTAAYGTRAAVCNNVGYQGVQGTYYYTGTADTASMGYAPTYTSSGAMIGTGFNYTGTSANSYKANIRVQATQEAADAPMVQNLGAVKVELISQSSFSGLNEEVLKAFAAQWMDLAKRAQGE